MVPSVTSDAYGRFTRKSLFRRLSSFRIAVCIRYPRSGTDGLVRCGIRARRATRHHVGAQQREEARNAGDAARGVSIRQGESAAHKVPGPMPNADWPEWPDQPARKPSLNTEGCLRPVSLCVSAPLWCVPCLDLRPAVRRRRTVIFPRKSGKKAVKLICGIQADGRQDGKAVVRHSLTAGSAEGRGPMDLRVPLPFWGNHTPTYFAWTVTGAFASLRLPRPRT
jgi:hypothetical protein